MKLVPDAFTAPERFETPNFLIRKLCVADTDIDYKAVMSNIEIIQKTRGGDWPTDALTYEEDKNDLAWHEQEFEERKSFAYIVMSPGDTEYIGCLYLYPPGFRDESSKDAEVDVSFWVTQHAYDKGLYKTLYQELDAWLHKDWPFTKIAYTNKELPN